MKKDSNDYELLLETLARMQEEKVSANFLIESLRQEMAALRELHSQEMEALRELHTQEMTAQRESFAMSIESMEFDHSEGIIYHFLGYKSF